MQLALHNKQFCIISSELAYQHVLAHSFYLEIKKKEKLYNMPIKVVSPDISALSIDIKLENYMFFLRSWGDSIVDKAPPQESK